ncbi:protein Star isoform X1 [Colias croceus]|uniref:protein Star isoform X1 n=1 Tax=Colias crocea TaxID=72248 RepID=UPI001E27D435|nr:protein Star isoform X1 [Colias croceus]
MAEKKIQENPLPEVPQEPVDKPKDVPKPVPKTTTVPIAPVPTNRFGIPSLTKTPPNELYRKLLPAILFVLTFVTVMTMLLIYMDTVAMGAQQFRLNMSQDYELASIPAESPILIAYVRQLHLAPRPPKNPPPVPNITDRVEVLDRLYGEIYNGTFVEILPQGDREPTTSYLEMVRGWKGVAVRAAPRDFLSLRGAASALHACLSPTAHPREVSYQEPEGGGSLFSSRVLCLPLHTLLLAAGVTRPHYALLAGRSVPAALRRLPASAKLQVIEFRSNDQAAIRNTTEYLLSVNYTVVATFHDSVMYALTDTLTRTSVTTKSSWSP